jgi:hypothetical protein
VNQITFYSFLTTGVDIQIVCLSLLTMHHAFEVRDSHQEYPMHCWEPSQRISAVVMHSYLVKEGHK